MNCIVNVDLGGIGSYLVPALICASALMVVSAVAFHRRTSLVGAEKLVFLLSAILVVGTFGAIVYQSNAAEIILDRNQLTARAPFVSGSARHDAVMWGRVDDATSDEFAMRTFGTSFSGVQIGWFQAESGRPALVLRSNEPSVRIPTSDGFDFVLSKSAFDQVMECAKERN